MGEYTIPGFLSGKNYRFTIAGDQPSPTEMQRMQGILQRDEQAYQQAYEQGTGQLIGPDPEEGTAISRGLERGIPQFQSALGTAAEYAGLEGVGDYLQNAAIERQRQTLARNPSIMESADFRDVRGLSSGLTYAGELLGEQLPLIGGTVAATGAASLAGMSLPVAATVGTIAASYPQLFGSNLQRQEGAVAAGTLPDVDVSRAALAAVGQTALEAASNALLVGQAGRGLGRALLTNIPAEAATEVGQQVLERKQAGLDLDSEDAYREYLDAGVAGGTLGGIFGGVSGLSSRRTTADGDLPAADEAQLQLPPPSPEELQGATPAGGPVGPPAEKTGVTRIQSRGLQETRVSLDNGERIVIPGSATDAQIEEAIRQYNAGRGPATPAEPTAAERAAAQAVQGLPDPTAPVTTATLDELGIPKRSATYRRFQNNIFSGPEAADQLQSMLDSVAATPTTEYVDFKRTVAPRVRDFISELRSAQPPSVPAREPTVTEVDAFEAAAVPEQTPTPAPTQDVETAAEEQSSLFGQQPEPEARRPLPALQQAQVAEALNMEFAASDLGKPSPQDYAAAERMVADNPTLDVADVAFDVATAKIKSEPTPVAEPTPAPAPETTPAPDVMSTLKPIPFDQYARKPGSAELVPGTNVRGEAPIIDLGGRKIVLREINGVQVPFYLSSGRAGKKDVPAGKWYPILGIGADGWINKGTQQQIVDYYGSPELRAAAQELDATIGDIRNDTSIPKVKPTGAHIEAINAGFTPTENQMADTIENLDRNLNSLLERIAGQPTPSPAASPAQPEQAVLANAVDIPLPDGTSAPIVFYDVSSTTDRVLGTPAPPRAIVIKPVNGVNVPFYQSTGAGGKSGVQSGKWYPFFGVTPPGWFVKTSDSDINNYYGSPALRKISEQLDAEVGDIRARPDSAPTITRDADTDLLAAINKDMHPNTTLKGRALLDVGVGQRVHQEDSKGTRAAIESTLRRIGQVTPAPSETTPPTSAKRERQLAPIRDYFTPGNIVESYGGTDRVVSFDVDSNGDWSVTVEPVKRGLLGQWVKDTTKEPLRTHQTTPDKRKIAKGPIARTAPAPTRAQDDADMQVLARYDELSGEQKNQLAAIAGIPREGNRLVSAILDAPDKFQSLMDQLTSTPDTQPPARQPMTGATPGAELGTAGQTIPDPVAPPVRPTPKPRPATQVKAPTPPADPVADAALANRIAEEFIATASPELLAQTTSLADTAETMPTTVADKAAVLKLLQEKPEQKSKMTAAEAAKFYAYSYFSKHPDPGTALYTIAYDLASAGSAGTPAKFRTEATIRAGEDVMTPQLAADLAYYKDTGPEAARKAAGWIRKNMSPETFAATKELQSRYRPRDYEAKSEAQDARKAKLAETREAEKDYLESIAEPGETFRDTTADEAAEYGLAQEDAAYEAYIEQITADFRPADVIGAPLHPRVIGYLRNGDLAGALRNFAATTTNKHLRSLANKLSPSVASARVQVVPDALISEITSTLRPNQRVDAAGIYMPQANAAELADMRASGREAAADLYEQYGGGILLNETSGLDAVTLMHEVAHAATDRVMANPSHPLTRQLTTLMDKIAPLTEPGFNGTLNVREFLAEGLTNPDFRAEMSVINPDGGKFSAWEMFTNRVKNFLRRMLGMAPKSLGSARDAIDTALDSVIAASPAERGAGDVLSSSFRPLGARKVLADFADRTRVPTQADLEQMKGTLRDIRIPTKFKETMMWLAMPLDYIADAATKYFPETARPIADLVGQHRAEKQTMMEQVQETLQSVVSWVKANPEKIDTFNDMRLTATRFGVDPRKDRSEYEGYTFEYDELDPSGTKVRTVTSKRYKTEAERNRAKYDHNMNADRFVSDGRSVFSEDTDQLAAYDAVKAQYQSLGAEGRQVVNTLFAIPEYLSAQLSDVLKSRLESMIPQNRALQERIYGQIYDKVFGRNAITPYQSLSRSGEYALSYIGIDPKDIDIDENGNVTREPEVGPTYFTHSFESSAARDAAIRLLEAQNPAYKIQQITPYQQSDPRRSQRVSPGFVAQVLNIVDTAAGVNKEARDKIVELVIDAAPETSFLNMFRARKGTRGFEGDISPLTQGLTAGDTIKNVTENSMRLTSNIADIKYGAKFAAARQALEKEARAADQATPTGNLVTAAQDAEERKMYLSALTSYTESAFRRQGGVAQTLTTGAWALTLGANVSTAAMTLFTVPTFVFGFLAGKFGAKNSMSAIGRASRLLAGTGGERSISTITPEGTAETARKKTTRFEVSIDNIDLSDPNSKFQYLAALQSTMRLNGVSGRSLTQDLLQGEMATGRFKVAQKLLAYSGVFQSTAERFSRETAAIAAYHLALRDTAKAAKMGDFSMAQLYKKLEDGSLRFTDAQLQEAAQYAVNTAEKTNGPMFAASGPQASQSDIGSVLYLFKRHPLAMYNLLYQTTMRSLPNKAELAAMSAADRAAAMEDIKIARLQLGGMMGMVGLTAGALGMPFVQQLGWLYDLFADDDEEDFETVVRTTMGEYGAFGLVDYLTGLRVSERIGLSGAFYRPGFNADNLPLLWQVVEGVGGPVVGLTLKYTDRVPQLFAQGDVWRGAEAVAPSAIANVLRAARYSQEGIQTMRGDPIIDDITPVSILSQALGFMPAEYARRLDQNAALSRIDNAIRQKRSDLLSKRYQAIRNGDTATFRDVEREIAEFNRRHPGPAMITQDTKESSLRAHEETSSRMHHGVNLSKQNIDYLMEIASQYGASSIFQ